MNGLIGGNFIEKKHFGVFAGLLQAIKQHKNPNLSFDIAEILITALESNCIPFIMHIFTYYLDDLCLNNEGNFELHKIKKIIVAVLIHSKKINTNTPYKEFKDIYNLGLYSEDRVKLTNKMIFCDALFNHLKTKNIFEMDKTGNTGKISFSAIDYNNESFVLFNQLLTTETFDSELVSYIISQLDVSGKELYFNYLLGLYNQIGNFASQEDLDFYKTYIKFTKQDIE